MTLPSIQLISDDMMNVMVGLAWSCPPGHFAEVGVYQGCSARKLYSVSQRQGRKLYLYDTFEGMPFKGEFDNHEVGLFSECSVYEVRDSMPEAFVIQGVFPKTVVPMAPVAFVHADADQYQSTVDICRVFAPLMVRGGMILFDDYYCVPSCVKAVDEYFPNREIMMDGRALVRF
jgi:O-methyltransferase